VVRDFEILGNKKLRGFEDKIRSSPKSPQNFKKTFDNELSEHTSLTIHILTFDMARGRVKARAQAGGQSIQNGAPQGKPMDRSPKSMVIRMGAGEVGASVSQLVKDMRHVMEPGTAIRLKERKSNKLKDYVTMAGPLGVTHLLLFSRSSSGNTNLRIAISPHGPTLHFRVENYSLCKDVLRAQRHPKGSSSLYLNPPLVRNWIQKQLK
jgi:ribosome biogenesis protein SSF1/2